jgi:hypothetical protein
LIALGYLPARGLWPLLIVGVIHSAALAPLAPLSDTLALGSAAPARLNPPCAHAFYYGWLRGAGSAAFILGTVLSGQAIGRFGIITVVWLNAGLLAMTAFAARIVPVLLPTPNAARPAMAKTMVPGLGALLRLPLYRRLVLVAALILGSHAMHDSFAVIRWRAAGIAPGAAGLMRSLSVAAEVIVFFFVGRPLLDRLGPAGAAMLAAAAGSVRWARRRSQQRRRLWPAVLLSPGRAAELLAVLTHDRGGRLQPNADGTALVDEGALCGDPPDGILRCQYRRHRHHLDMRDPKANNAVLALAIFRRSGRVVNVYR